MSKTGIIELDNDGKIVNFLEKPSLEDTLSRKSVSYRESFMNHLLYIIFSEYLYYIELSM